MNQLSAGGREDAGVRVYWMPGCSSCLRAKEFLERSGLPYQAINVDESPAEAAELVERQLMVPVVRKGDEFVSGVDLMAVAKLVGAKYVAPVMLEPSVLMERYRAILFAVDRFVAQMTDPALEYRLPGRERPIFDVATQCASVMRAFLTAYYEDQHKVEFYETPDDVRTKDDILKRSSETLAALERWWNRDGQDDPLDRVTTTYWGFPTLHEVLEREVWHTAQHARQLAHVLKLHGIEPDGPLTAEQLSGLPLPERIHD